MNKLKISLSFMSFLVIKQLAAQTLVIQSGTSISKFSKNSIYTTKPVIMLGCLYLNKKYFDISSNVGYISRYSTFEDFNYYTGEPINLSSGFSSITLNTIFDLKIPIRKFSFLISAGPRVDFMVSNTINLDQLPTGVYINKRLYGAVVGTGFKVDAGRFNMGLRCSYYYDINEFMFGSYNLRTSNGIFTLEEVSVRPQLFTVTMDVGIKLGKLN